MLDRSRSESIRLTGMYRSGDMTKLKLAANDSGGQLDSSKHTPEGAQVFLGENQPASSWVVSLALLVPTVQPSYSGVPS